MNLLENEADNEEKAAKVVDEKGDKDLVVEDKEVKVRKTTKKTSTTNTKTSKKTTNKATKTAKKTSAKKSEGKAKVKASTEKVELKEKNTKESIDMESLKNATRSIAVEVDKTKLTNFNEYLFHQGKNYEAYNILGSHKTIENDEVGIQFATWAPNARAVYVVGDFNNFEVKDEYKLERITDNGIWKGFFKEPQIGQKYKYCIIDANGKQGEFKADPYAIQSELRPGNASIIYEAEDFKWTDTEWISMRDKVNVLEQPLNIYEIHLGSWKRKENGDFLSYEEICEELPSYIKEMGYTHIEIMPLVEHPLDASWGYQGTGYYSPTSRYGNLEGLKKLINRLHEENIGVIMDWAPGHFCKDAHGLYKFDGTPTYEYQEEWRAENKGWGTCNFDLGRPEVKSFLISNALYWLREFHVDGLRVDAVSSILYLDYSRQPGEWVPNKFGGNGNLEAIDFLKQLNEAVFNEYPTTLMIAEESTAWPNVTKPAINDGLGFNMKWNMGWMNDTLEYVEIDPKYRKHNHRNITFAMMYNYAENYLLPLSHDEVVHGKKSLVEKMWGDEWNKYAGLRAFMGYMMGHPGKKLSFMGCEFAQGIEWREYEGLEWNLINDNEINRQTQLFFKDLNHLYLDNKAFWELDHNYKGFNWIEADNNEQSILIFTRRSRDDEDTLVFVVNFTPIVYYDYQIGVPFLGEYEELFNTDDAKYGGSGQTMDTLLVAEKAPFHNQPYSLKIKVPPMATLVLKIKDIKKENNKNLLIDNSEQQ
ncbi:1,4-alpha-glucan branching protein GlgB [Clostridium sp. SM-530-WT-3G]|nr:1,4-alpha-glucan branching protein GlgB [Clostridium sp. SM-530-WT-3G]